jgi:quinol-cytochrome oxidoreductase complex cytochrome b subunit
LHPHHTILIAVAVLLAILSVVSATVPHSGGQFLGSDAIGPASRLNMPGCIGSPCCFTVVHELLRAVPSFLKKQTWGMLVLGAGLLLLFAVPSVDDSPKTRRLDRPLRHTCSASQHGEPIQHGRPICREARPGGSHFARGERTHGTCARTP